MKVVHAPPTHARKLPVIKPLKSKFSDKDMMAVLCLWVIFLVELLVLVNPGSSVAPGDEEPLCEQLRAVGVAPIPAYSANMRVLMDSWNYQNLLPPRTEAVWDQVDNDMNNPDGITSNVSRPRKFYSYAETVPPR